jgi:hypothetical protein
MDLSVDRAAKKYGVSRAAICYAIRRGSIPVTIIQVSQFRMKDKDVAKYVAAIPKWRIENGRRGGRAKAANIAARGKRRPTASADTARSA